LWVGLVQSRTDVKLSLSVIIVHHTHELPSELAFEPETDVVVCGLIKVGH